MSSERRRFHPCQPSPSPVGSAPPSTRSRRSARCTQVLRAARSGLRLGPPPRDGHAGAPRGRPSVASGATRTCCPSTAPEEPRLAPGFTPLVPAPRLAEERRRPRALAEARHGEPDALVQGSRRRRRRPQGAGARPRDARVLVDRQPRRRRCRARGRRGPGGGGVRPRRPRAGEARCGGRVRPDALRRRRSLRPLLAAHGRALVRAAVGLRQRQPPLVLRRGVEDPRVRDRRAARTGARPTSSRSRSRPGALFHKVGQGFARASARSGSSTAPSPRLVGGQAEGCQPVATAFRDGRPRARRCGPSSIARSLAIGNPADGDFAVATARETGGAIHAVPEDEIGENMALLARTTGVFGETAAGVTLGALRAAVEAGDVRRVRPGRAARHRRRPEDARARSRSRSPRCRSRPTRTRSSTPWRPPPSGSSTRGRRVLWRHGADAVREGLGRPRRARGARRARAALRRPPPRARGHVGAGVRGTAPRRTRGAAAGADRRDDGPQRADD